MSQPLRDRDIEKMAQDFAASWYSRPPSGCDQETLAALASYLLRDVVRLSVQAERARIAARLAGLVDP